MLRTTVTAAAIGLALVLAGCAEGGPGATQPTQVGTPEPAPVGPTPSRSFVAPTAPMSEVPSSDPTPSASQVRLLEVTVTGTTVEPAPDQVDLAVGETLRLLVTSDGGSAIHTHGLGDIEAPLTPGEPTTVDLVGDVPGVYEVELHDPDLLLLQVAVR